MNTADLREEDSFLLFRMFLGYNRLVKTRETAGYILPQPERLQTRRNGLRLLLNWPNGPSL